MSSDESAAGQTRGTRSSRGRGGAEAGPPSAIDRAVDLITVMVEAPGPMTLAEAASAAGLAKPTAHRILRILVARGLLRQGADGSYRLGPRLYALGGQALAKVEFVADARPGLKWLEAVTPETIHFAMLLGDQLTYVEKIEGRRPYRMSSTLGMALTMHCTAIGKAVLAHLPPERREHYLQPELLVRRTANTITKVGVLEAELDEIRARGFSIDDGENEEEIRCVGTAVFDARQSVIGGISVSAPMFQMTPDQALSLAPAVMTAGRTVSLALGASADALPTPAGVAADARPTARA
jgi:DNA-binding IclR family transcriptional regulator